MSPSLAEAATEDGFLRIGVMMIFFVKDMGSEMCLSTDTSSHYLVFDEAYLSELTC